MFRLGRVAGTTIDVEPTFLILIAFFVITEMQPGRPAALALMWAPIVFVSVLLHELAHAIAIALFRLGPSQILLGGMGGVTINTTPRTAWKQVLISAAGPASSFVLAWLCSIAGPQRDPMLAAMLPTMTLANFWWGVFNLLPIIPLDGGQALLNLFRTFLSDRRALLVSVWIGIPTAIAFGVWAAFRGVIVAALLMGMFVFRLWGVLRTMKGDGGQP